MARDRGHVDKLGDVLEERLGSRPHLEVRAADEDASGAVAATAREEPVREEPPPETGSPNGSVAFDGNPAPEAAAGDDVIRDQREVFEMAREFGLFDQNKGT